MERYFPKQQIACIPTHVLETQDCIEDIEFGFVTEDTGRDYVFCRYWFTKKLKDGKVVLRTKANSEATPRSTLFVFDKVPQDYVENAWNEYVEKGEDND